MGVEKYRTKQGSFWKVDLELTAPDGKLFRFRKRKVPTSEMAEALQAKIRIEAFEGRFFDKPKTSKLTVADVWTAYEPVCRRDNAAWQTEVARSRCILRHLGEKRATSLTVADVDAYRNVRLAETTRTGRPPSPATLDREVELLKRALNYAVTCDKLPANPIAKAKLLRKPNVRRSMIDEATFATLLANTDAAFRPVVLFAYDSGMRSAEVRELRWDQVDMKAGVVRLMPQETKGGESRIVYLTARVKEMLATLPRGISDQHVFLNPKSGKRSGDVRTMFRRACKKAGVAGLWFHDLRRSFVTNACRRGIAESVVMKMSGHRTRAVFDRYNIVSETDLAEAISRIEAGQAIELAAAGEASVTIPSKSADRVPKTSKPPRLSTEEASGF